MSGLQLADDGGGGPARCAICGSIAAGPCARCDAPTCGDCCVLTEGGAKLYAVCLRCERRVGKDLGAGWVTVVGWIALPIIGLAALLIVLGLVAHACR